MASYNHSGLFAPGAEATKHTGSWVSTWQAPVHEHNFEADINTIAEEAADDSGYYSNDTEFAESKDDDFTSLKSHSSSHAEHQTAGSIHPSHSFYFDAAASNKSDQGTVFDDVQNKSTTHFEQVSSLGKQLKGTRKAVTLFDHVHEDEHKESHMFSFIQSAIEDPLQTWEKATLDYEFLAHGVENPSGSAKRRKTGSKK